MSAFELDGPTPGDGPRRPPGRRRGKPATLDSVGSLRLFDSGRKGPGFPWSISGAFLRLFVPDRRRPTLAWLGLAAILLLVACGGADLQPAAEWGAKLAASPRMSSSPSNQVACTTCHAVSADDERILPGYPLLGAFDRPSFWGGYEPDLRGAVDACLLFFMKGRKLDPGADDARALYDYLATLAGAGERGPLPLTIVTKPGGALPPGDPTRGENVHRLACEQCHGGAGSGVGRLVSDAPILPDQAVAEARELFPNDPPAAVFAEKIRHGQFYSVGGTMPLYSLEALSDEDLASLLAFYGIE